MIEIDPQRKYTRTEVMKMLEFNVEQLNVAISRKLIIFPENMTRTEPTMYGIYFFQFLMTNCEKLERIKNG
jgi:hypothetical protein